MKRQMRAAGRRLAEAVAPTMMASISDVSSLQQQVRAQHRQLRVMRDRIASLEDEVQEARRLNRRIAELTDVVEEVLLPAAGRDDDRLRRLLDRYVADSF